MLVISNSIYDLLKKAQNSLQGYGPRSYMDFGGDQYSERWVGDAGTSPWSRVDTAYRERVINYKKEIAPGMQEEWGEDKGQKPNGTQLIKKRRRKKGKDNKDLGYITEFERINRSEPKFVGRVQKHWRRKNDYSSGKTPPGNRGAWSHYHEYDPKIMGTEPTTWSERENQFMFL